jgi:small subunit ribosomal protein S4
MYGLLEKQFRNLFAKADRLRGITGENFLNMLERRLDNVVFRAGFANSRAEARQLVRHGHFLVNGKRVNIPSLQTDKGDEIVIRDKSHNLIQIKAAIEASKRREVPQWLEVSIGDFKAKVRDLPARDDIGAPIEERLIVELYSK